MLTLDKENVNKKFYITTSIAYTNAPPHIGFALELVQADVLARYHRILGDDVFFLTGTDEHGIKVLNTASEAGETPQEFTKKITTQFQSLTGALSISNDDFIRTTDKKRHWPSVEKVWRKLKESGDIYKKKYKGCYCPGCEVFITEKDLVTGKCPVHLKEPEIIEEENYFFRLSKYSKEIENAIKKDELKIIPQTRKNEILSFVKKGLEDVSFSRAREKLSWGILVPDDPSQTIYVWADALTNYISVLGYAENSEKLKTLWPADVQIIGKDILRFHSVIWPAMLLSLGLELPKTIFVHGFITANGQKMSKSLGNVVDPFELVKKYGTDAVRYFLLREIPPTEDGDFTIEKFEERYNADLANNLGNLLSRVLNLTEQKLEGRVPEIEELRKINDYEEIYKKQAIYTEKIWIQYEKIFDKIEINAAVLGMIKVCSDLNKWIDNEQLWSLFERNQRSFIFWIYIMLERIRHIGWWLVPFLPETSNEIFRQLGLNPEEEKKKKFKEAIKWGGLKSGTQIKKGSSLFPKIK